MKPKHVTATPEASISGKEKGGNEEFRHVYMYVARICSYKNIGSLCLLLLPSAKVHVPPSFKYTRSIQLFVSKHNPAFIPVVQVYSWSIVPGCLLGKCIIPTTAAFLLLQLVYFPCQ